MCFVQNVGATPARGAETPTARTQTMAGIQQVSHTLCIFSGKGGVGKSTLTHQLALYLQAQGLRVGILDADLCGPSMKQLLCADGDGAEKVDVKQGVSGWIPIDYTPTRKGTATGHPIKLMSIAYLTPDADTPIVWRGPKKRGMIESFLSKVDWGALDCLLVDSPPGTGDEHLTLVECIPSLYPPLSDSKDNNNDSNSSNSNSNNSNDSNDNKSAAGARFSAIIITTPQIISIQDCQKQVQFCKQTNTPITGIVENMSGWTCGGCGHMARIWGEGGGALMAKRYGIDFMGSVPVCGTAVDNEHVDDNNHNGGDGESSGSNDGVAAGVRPEFALVCREIHNKLTILANQKRQSAQ